MSRRVVAAVAVALAALGAALLLPEWPSRAPAGAAQVVFDSPLAGTWYSADADSLRAGIEGDLEAAANTPPLPAVQALLLPHAGYRWSGPTAACAVRQVRGRHYERVLVIGPSHYADLENCASLPAFTHLRTPLGQVPVDLAFVERLRLEPLFIDHPGASQPEHSVQIQVPLLQVALDAFALVPIVVGRLDARTADHMGRILAAMVDERTLVVASSDFTHYGSRYSYVPFAPSQDGLRRLDMGAFDRIRNKDLAGFLQYCDTTGATICGRDAIAVLLAMLPPEARFEPLAYTTSGQLTGDFSNSVSYLAAAVVGSWPRAAPAPTALTAPSAPLSAQDEKALLALARATLEYAFAHRRVPEGQELGVPISPAMRQIRGAFVTLKSAGQLRGCVGEIQPARPLYRAVVAQAIHAAFGDRRFAPVQAAELPQLVLEISVLTPPRSVPSWRQIVIGRDGIVLQKDGRSAVFLPQVAGEQGWDLEQTLSQLAAKAGLPPDAWKAGAHFLVFQATVFGEGELQA